jgi:peroxidase
MQGTRQRTSQIKVLISNRDVLYSCSFLPSPLERWDATLQGIAHAEEYIKNMDKSAHATATKQTAASLLKKFFRRASAKSVAIGKARIKMERAVKHAERVLLDKKRVEIARTASKEDLAEVIAEELYHKPGTILNKKELAHIYSESKCEELRPEINCLSIATSFSRRQISGVCNNLEHPTQGASFTPFQRVVGAHYENGIDSFPNQADQEGFGPFLPPSPSARLVSIKTIPDREINDSRLNHITMQWGQFMDHDLDLAVEFQETECNLETCEETEICAPVRVTTDDKEFGLNTARNGLCLPFQRTVPACVENPFEFTARKQVNELTHYIDGSMVYGSTDSLAKFLREHEGGLLRVSDGDNLPLQPPFAPEEGPLGNVNDDPDTTCPEGFVQCGVAGDSRALEHVSLTVMHTVWVREHNRVARALAQVNPEWGDERLYLEARDIVIAEIQQITFREYLPALYGSNLETFIPQYTGYNPLVDASVPNSFATAAYRFGHSQIQPLFERLDNDGVSIARGPLNLKNSFFSPTEFAEGGGVTPMVNGWLRQPTRAVDEFLNSILTTQLFETEHEPGMDLATLNIQRGRDHGLPSFLKFRKFCFDSYKVEGSFRNMLTESYLRGVYGNLENIELFVGALAEEPLSDDSALGPVLACLFGITFSRLRDGDRFWYENNVFTPNQLEQIRRTSFARILCDVGGITSAPPNVFLTSALDSCDSFDGIDFEPWAEETCFYKSSVTAQELVKAEYLDRPRGTRRRDLEASFLSNTNVPTCIPFRCPTPEAPQRDVIVVVPRVRRPDCLVTGRGDRRGRRSFFRRVTASNVQSNILFFDTLAQCEASNQLLVAVACDGAKTSANIASTAELENELAKALGNGHRTVAHASTLAERGSPKLKELDGSDLRELVDNDPTDPPVSDPPPPPPPPFHTKHTLKHSMP